ncbi:MAG: methyl-accepting chemotaxis protein [Rhodothalassiaceae bacterium]
MSTVFKKWLPGQHAASSPSLEKPAPAQGTGEAPVLAKIAEVLHAAAHGDLERRVLGIDPDSPEAPVLHALNQILDLADAYVRETRASLDAAQEGRFHRLFLERGMRGTFGQGAGIINESVRGMEKAAAEEQERAERQAARLEAVQNFGEKLDTTVEKLSRSAAHLDKIAKGLETRMEKMLGEGELSARNAQESLESAQAIASGATELAAAIDEISRQASDTDGYVQHVRADVGNAVRATSKLREAAESVDKVVLFIRDIAEKTNLLALNATIEAARAGDAGRGFAVVASEVKALATQTGKATDDIARQIAAMQTATKETTDAISAIDVQAEKVAQVVSAIAAAVEEQSAATNEISSLIETTAQKSEEMAAQTDNIRTASRESADAVRDVLEQAGELAQESEALKSAAGAFLSQIRS